MKINNLMNSFNFGLTKSHRYENSEYYLLLGAKNMGQANLVRNLPEEIAKQVPKGLLDTDSKQDIFILVKDISSNPLECYDFGYIDYTRPAETLVNLYKHLYSFSKNFSAAKRIYKNDNIVLKKYSSLKDNKLIQTKYVEINNKKED